MSNPAREAKFIMAGRHDNEINFQNDLFKKDTNNDSIKSLNHGFGPVFKRRQNRDFIMDFTILIIFFFIMVAVAVRTDGYKTDFKVLNSETNLPGLEFIGYFTALISALIAGDMLRRFTLFIEERNHVEGRHGGSPMKALKACIEFKEKNSSKLVLVLFLIGHIVTLYYWIIVQPYISICLYISIVIMSSIGMRFLGFHTLAEVEVSEFNEKYSANVAEALAYIFYYGYLRLILPKIDTTIEKSCNENHKVGDNFMSDIISTNKVFVIISKNCRGYAKFIDIDPRISYKGNLFPLHYTRGGEENREYKSSLYEVKLENRKPEYLMLEYAVPLLSMYEMANDINVSFTMQDLEEQVTAFYLKLTEILENDSACRGKCQLILCADVTDNLPEVICGCLDDPKVDIV